ncbi:MAG: helix-turn-helix transcriptional regulator [Bryobacteraceae bacterium]|jgi:transcriptional regulator with XRE-family HTH domain
MTATKLKTKRAAAGIPGYAVCQVAGISRAKLSDVERGYVTASPEELQRIDGAIEQILQTRQHLAALASEAGLCLTGIRL